MLISITWKPSELAALERFPLLCLPVLEGTLHPPMLASSACPSCSHQLPLPLLHLLTSLHLRFLSQPSTLPPPLLLPKPAPLGVKLASECPPSSPAGGAGCVHGLQGGAAVECHTDNSASVKGVLGHGHNRRRGLWHRVRRSFPSLPEHKGFFLFIIEEPQFSLPSSYNWDRNKNSMMGIGTLVSHQELKR